MATINGTFNSLIAGTLSGTVATPGAQGPAGPAGSQGIPGVPGAPGVGVPAGGLTNQFLVKTSNADFATGWTTFSLAGYATEAWVQSQGYITSSALTPYLSKAGNLDGLTNLALARDNLQLGELSNPTFAGVNVSGSGTNDANLGPTFLTLNQSGHGQFTIQPSQGIVFPDASIQTTAFPAGSSLPSGGTVGQVLTKNSGTNYDASFATLIPGDRYLTSSTTSLTIDNANKTLTVGTGLSYTPTQNITISYNASNHMHGEVLTYDSGTGVLTVDINNHTGSGTYAAWVVNVGGVTPATSVAWGAITGTLGSQTDLATALNSKLEVSTAASTYQTLSGMSSYLTTSAAAASYYPLTGNPSGFLTSAPVTSVAGRTGAITLSNTDISGLGTMSTVNDAPSDGSTYGRNNGAWVAAGGGSTFTGGPITSPITYASGDNTSTFASTLIDVTKTAASAGLPFRTTNIDGDRLIVSYQYDDYGVTRTDAALYNYKGFSSSRSSSSDGYTFDVGYTTPGSITYTSTNMGSPSGAMYITPGYITFSSPSYPSSPATFGLGGLTFSDGTTQTTAAGGTASPYYNAVWYNGNWYSANVSTVYDVGYNYINVLSF